MESLHFNYDVEESKPIFTTASENLKTCTTQGRFATPYNTSASGNGQECVFSPLVSPFQSLSDNEYLSTRTQQEPRPADTAPSTSQIDEVLKDLHINNSDWQFDNLEHDPHNSYLASDSNVWSENSDSGTRNWESDTFDFLLKSPSSVNNYLSTLTREQLSLLRSILLNLLCEFLLEVVRVLRHKRLRRALPKECVFCKNNGESEENYSSHALKDGRGRVICPVLRAYRCLRCGATGDRAHTMKYCPKNADAGS